MEDKKEIIIANRYNKQYNKKTKDKYLKYNTGNTKMQTSNLAGR